MIGYNEHIKKRIEQIKISNKGIRKPLKSHLKKETKPSLMKNQKKTVESEKPKVGERLARRENGGGRWQ